MLAKVIEDLALDIAAIRDTMERRAFGDTSGRSKKMVQEDPEAWLVSLLERIKKELPEVSATLYNTVDCAFYKERIVKARERLK